MLVLIIRDGWGVHEANETNAVHLAQPKHYLSLIEKYPRALLQPGGTAVGLPEGQMGNSEVGHMNIGSGRVVWQDLALISRDLEKKTFQNLPAVQNFLKTAQSGNRRIHLLGLVSDGGVHSHQEHLHGILDLLKEQNFEEVYVHAFTDGRDTSPTSGKRFLAELEGHMQSMSLGKIATISGRFYAMDRDKRWERVQKAYDTLVHGKGEKADKALDYLEQCYADNVTDEFLPPATITPEGQIRAGDSVLFFNFRPDRAREISQALLHDGFDGFLTKQLDLNYLCMTPYGGEIQAPVAYPKENLRDVLSEVISKAGLKQFKIAETEKYAHVTYFLNGGREEPFSGEERELIPSPRVETYDLQPEMSAKEVTRKLIEAIESEKYAFLCVNFANPDMVGHTGNMEAAMKAVTTVDTCVDEVLQSVLKKNGTAIITADHGNLDEMFDLKTKEVLTNHSLNPVDFLLVSPDHSPLRHARLKAEGKLADIAPTILRIMELPTPESMDGDCLLQ